MLTWTSSLRQRIDHVTEEVKKGTAPLHSSTTANKNGRFATKSTAGLVFLALRHMDTAVAAAATVPSSYGTLP